jgi:hypothetical protein
MDSNDDHHLRLLARPELGVTFTKIAAWLLTDYEKCVAGLSFLRKLCCAAQPWDTAVSHRTGSSLEVVLYRPEYYEMDRIFVLEGILGSLGKSK